MSVPYLYFSGGAFAAVGAWWLTAFPGWLKLCVIPVWAGWAVIGHDLYRVTESEKSREAPPQEKQ